MLNTVWCVLTMKKVLALYRCLPLVHWDTPVTSKKWVGILCLFPSAVLPYCYHLTSLYHTGHQNNARIVWVSTKQSSACLYYQEYKQVGKACGDTYFSKRDAHVQANLNFSLSGVVTCNPEILPLVSSFTEIEKQHSGFCSLQALLLFQSSVAKCLSSLEDLHHA